MSELRVEKKTFLKVSQKLDELTHVVKREFERPLGINYIVNMKPSVFCALLDKYNALTCVTHHWAEGKTSLFYYSDEEFSEILASCENSIHYSEAPISVFQLLTSLQCINYNLNIEGWEIEKHLSKTEFYEYTHVREILQKLIHILLAHIVSYDKRYQESKWG